MRFEKILVIMQKEFDEIMKNKIVLSSILIMPLVFAILLPLTMILPIAFSGDMMSGGQTNQTQEIPGMQIDPGLGIQGSLIMYFMMVLMPLFMLLPAMLPVIISSYSIIGEKKNRTLEPLLAAPVSVYEIIVGKALSAIIPALLATWISTLLFFGISEAITTYVLHTLIFPDMVVWLVAMVIIAPLLSFLGVLITLVISSKANDPRVAQQISVVFLLPLIGLFIVQMSGLLTINRPMLFAMAAGILIIDIIALRISNTMFDREEILTKWKS